MWRRTVVAALSVVSMVGPVWAEGPVPPEQTSEVVGTWRGSAYEFASFYLQGRAEITVTLTPDGRWSSVWRQAGREQRSTGRWHAGPDTLVLEYDSAQTLPPRLSFRRRGQVAFATAVIALPEGRSTTVSIALTRS